jgi:hypothetical protein
MGHAQRSFPDMFIAASALSPLVPTRIVYTGDNCIVRNRKFGFICLPQSQNNMWRELYIPSPVEQFLSAQCCCHSVLQRTSSHHIIIIINCNIISLLHNTLRKSMLILFLGWQNDLAMGPLASYCCFPTLPPSAFGHRQQGPVSRLAITRTIWSGLTRTWGPPLSLLSFECLWLPFTRSSLPVWLSRQPPDLSGLDSDIPPWLCVIFLLIVFIEWFPYIIHCSFIVYLLPGLIQWFSFIVGLSNLM